MNIKEYLSKYDFDVRKSGDARFMDQKCTPDVVCIISDCVINFVGYEHSKLFTVNDIWNSQYFIKNVKAIFNKPLATNPTVKHEYDKFIQQPLKMLAYAKVLNIDKKGNTNYYSVANYDILDFVSLRDRNAYLFLSIFLEKVLVDSGIYKYFEDFKEFYIKNKLDQNYFQLLKSRFQKFIIGNTNINGIVEVNRIFPKILNVYATQNNLPGTIKGSLSKHPFYFTDLMYNRKNWRDISKDKNISRQEFEMESEILMSEIETPYNDYLIQKAVNLIRRLYNESEIKDQWANGEATQVHHIFPKNEFPQIAHCVENLIKITATQHYTMAHPSNRTTGINKDYQLVCLLAKSDSIEKSLSKNEEYYRKESFIHCINIGLKTDLKSDISFIQLKKELTSIYNNI